MFRPFAFAILIVVLLQAVACDASEGPAAVAPSATGRSTLVTIPRGGVERVVPPKGMATEGPR